MSAPVDAALPASLTLVGAGKMGGAMLAGWLAGGLDPARTTVLDPQASPEMQALCAARGLALNPAAPPVAEALVLAMKPQGLEGAAPALAPLVGAGTLVVSILAGKTIANLRDRLPGARAIVRAMPNLPASIGRGATGAVASPEVDDRQRAQAHALLASVGLVEWLDDEGLIDALTARVGLRPGLRLPPGRGDGARRASPPACPRTWPRASPARPSRGPPRSSRPIPATPALLRQDVTSPGGTTAEALAVLMRDGGLPDLMREAVDAARRRAGDLAG